MEKLTVARATSDDAPALASILTEATGVKLNHGDDSWGSEPYSEQEAGRFIHLHPTYLAHKGTELVGTVTLQLDDESIWGAQKPDAVYIHRLAVKSGYGGQGIGEQMLGWANEQAALSSRRFLRLDCDAANSGLCAYYEKQGFVKVGEKRVSGKAHTSALYRRPVVVR